MHWFGFFQPFFLHDQDICFVSFPLNSICCQNQFCAFHHANSYQCICHIFSQRSAVLQPRSLATFLHRFTLLAILSNFIIHNFVVTFSTFVSLFCGLIFQNSRLLCIPRIVWYHFLLPLFLTCPLFCQRARSCSVPLVLDCISNSLPLTNFLPVNFKKIQNRAGQPHHHFFVTIRCQVRQHKPGTKINPFSWSHWNSTNCVSWTQENFFLSTTELGFLQMKKQPKLSSTLLTSLDTTKS